MAHALGERVAGALEARQVDGTSWSRRRWRCPRCAAASLRLVGDDGDLPAAERVDERRLADVGCRRRRRNRCSPACAASLRAGRAPRAWPGGGSPEGGTVDFGKGVRPHCAVFGPRNGLLYVTTELDNSVTVIDPQALKVVGTIPTGQPESHMLAITRDGRRGYTSNVGPGTVSVLDLEAKKLLAVIPVSATAQRIALSVDDRWVFTADQAKPRLAVIDAATNAVKTWVPLPGVGYGTAPTPDGKWLVVAMPRINQVGVLDLETMQVARTFVVPKAPQEVLIRPDGMAAYVSCDASRQVAVIDLKNWKVEKLIDAGPGADGIAWAEMN